MKKTCVCVRNLCKSFEGRKVIDNLSFEVKKGEVFALLGHNGAGKSTTIDLILGLKKPDSGDALIFGLEAGKNRKKVFEKTGVQLQQTQYQGNITVEEACIEYSSLYSKCIRRPYNCGNMLQRFYEHSHYHCGKPFQRCFKENLL